MDIKSIIKTIWTNPKKRNLAIMSIMLIILLVIGIHKYLSRPVEIPPGALHALMCKQCGEKYNKRIVDIANHKFKCEICGGKLYQAYKCTECDFEFCVIPMERTASRGRTMELFKMGVEMSKCPNCGSTATIAVSIKDYKKKPE